MDRLFKLGIQGCVLCKLSFEDTNHLLFNCPYSQSCWEWLRRMLGWYTPFPKSLSDLLKGWSMTLIKGVYSKLWNISPSIVVGEIWKCCIFHNLEFKLEDLITKIEASIVETTNAYLRNIWLEEGSFLSWEGHMKKLWPNLINPPLFYMKNNKEARKNCRWQPPPIGWVKLNFDRDTCGNPGIAGIRCIINNEARCWIAKKAMSIKPTSNNLVEIESLYQGIHLCLKLNLTKVIIEGDTQIVLNAII